MTRHRPLLLAPTLLALASAIAVPPAHGQTLVQFASVDNTSGGAPLDGFNTFDINLISSGETWTGSQLYIQLQAGSFFRSALGSSSGDAPSPALFAAFPDLEFDTYFANGATTPLGALDLGGNAGATIPANGGTSLDEFWFSTPGGIYDLTHLQTARVSVSDDAIGTVRYLASVDGVFNTFEYTGDLAGINFGEDRVVGGLNGDLDVDGRVSQADLDLVLLNWGDAQTPAAWLDKSQFDGGQIGQGELDGVLLNWGDQNPPPVLPQPDPFAEGAGDYDDNGFVSQGDLDQILLAWGDTVLPPGLEDGPLGGGAFDGLISQNESDGVLLNWANGVPPGAVSVPEPGTAAALLAIGAFGVTRRRR